MTSDVPRIGEFIQVRSGGRFYPLDPRPEEIHIGDIAHALANQCRYTGHVREFWSVAQHSVLVSRVTHPGYALHGLLHDASEAYIADVSRPVKHDPSMQAYRKIERRLQHAIYCRFGLIPIEPTPVKVADDKVLVAEVRALMTPDPAIWSKWTVDVEPVDHTGEAIVVEPVGPVEAKRMFLDRWDELSCGREPGVTT